MNNLVMGVTAEGAGDEILEEFSKLADACIADEDIDSSSQAVNNLLDQTFARFWVRDVSCKGDELRAISRQLRLQVLQETLVFGSAEVINANVAAVS